MRCGLAVFSLLLALGVVSHTQVDALRPLLFAAEGSKKILEYDSAGRVIWDYPAEMSRDVWRLAGGNTLFCYNLNYDSKRDDNTSGVMEVTRGKKVVFDFKTTGQVFSCQRLADGNTLVGAASQGKLLIVAPDGRIVRQIQVRNKPGHSCMRNARQIANGNFLVAEESASAVREYDAEGQLVREMKVNFRPYSAVRLRNGNTIICGQKSIVELDIDGKESWTLQASDLPQVAIRWFAGIQVLPNGNLFLCNAGGAVGFLEISREKRIAWQSNLGSAVYPVGHGIQRLDIPGPGLK
jgi:hypothetical protein